MVPLISILPEISLLRLNESLYMFFKDVIVDFGSLMLILFLLADVTTLPILVRFVLLFVDLDNPELAGLDLFVRTGVQSMFSGVRDILTNSGVKKFTELDQAWKNIIFPLFRVLLD